MHHETVVVIWYTPLIFYTLSLIIIYNTFIINIYLSIYLFIYNIILYINIINYSICIPIYIQFMNMSGNNILYVVVVFKLYIRCTRRNNK